MISSKNSLMVSLILFSLAMVFILGIADVSAAPGDTIYVNNQTGNDAWDGLNSTWNGTSGPKASIRNATGTVNANGVVNVANGVYNKTGDRNIAIARNMTIRGESRDNTIIDALGSGRIFTVNSGVNLILQDLTIRNGSVSGNGGAITNAGTLTVTNCNFINNRGTGTSRDGGAIYSTNSLTVKGCSFTSNSATRNGGAIYLSTAGSLSVSDSNFNGNTAANGGAIYNSRVLSVTNSNFTSNTATTNGGAIWSGSTVGGTTLTVTGSNFGGPNAGDRNSATNGGAIYNNAGTSTIKSNNFNSNAASYLGGAFFNSNGAATIQFNRIIGNTPNNNQIRQSGGSVNAQYNWWGSNTTPSGKVSGTVNYNPWLVLTVAASNSPIQTSGFSTVTADLTHDSNGINLDPASGHVPDGTPVTFTLSPSGIGFLSTLSGTTTDGSLSTIFTAGSNPGTATVTAAADTVAQNTAITIMRNDVYVSTTGSDTTGDGSPSKPYATILTAYNNVYPGGNIHILSGTYTGINNRNIAISKNVNIMGEGGIVTINAQTVSRIFTINSGYAVTMSDLTLTNGLSTTDGGAIYNQGNLNLINCIFSNNRATNNGGAIWNNGPLTITGSTFTGNNATDGAAIWNRNTLNIISSIFTSNTASDDGGAISNGNDAGVTGGTVTITNSYFNNNAGVYGGALWSNGPVTITGSNFTNNRGSYGGVIRNWGPLTITGSNFENNIATTNGGVLSNRQGTAALNFNRFYNNGVNDIRAEYNNAASTVNAENNWWGTNFQGTNPVAAGRITAAAGATVDADPWIILKISASPNAIHSEEDSTVTADLTWNSNNVQPTGGQLPDGMTVLFGGNLGTLNPASSTIINTATSTFTAGTVPGTATVNATVDSQTVSTTIRIDPKAVLTITNTANNSSLNVGQTGIFTVAVTNNGPNAATNIKINAPLPAGFTVDTHGIGTYSGGIWTINSLANGTTATLTFTGVLTPGMAGTNVTNHVTAAWNEYPGTVSVPDSTIHVKKASTSITVTPSNTAPNVGQQFYYTITVTNNGGDDATGVNVANSLPAGLTMDSFTASQGTFVSGQWDVGTIANGNSATLIVYVTPQSSVAGQNITTTATITQNEYPQSATTSSTVHVKRADVALSQTGSYSGNKVTFVVTATNNGRDTATNIVINNPVPAGLTGVTVTPSVGSYDSNTGIWTIPSLADLATATLTITGNATPQSTVINTVTLAGQTEYNSNIPQIVKNSVYVPSVNIAVYNTAWYYLQSTQKYQTKYVVGNSPVFMWSAVNSNTRDEATGVVLEYIIPKGFEYVGCNNFGMGSITYDYDNVNQRGILTWNVGYMPKGGMVTTYVTLIVKTVGNRTTDLTTIANLKNVDQTDINHNNDQNITCAIESPPSADVQVNQTYTQNGSQVTYTITATNNGPSNATGVQITDLLPTGVQYVSDNSGGTYNNTTGLWNIGNIPNGETKTLNITALITGTGTIINTAKVTNQTESDSNFNNNGQTTYIIRS